MQIKAEEISSIIKEKIKGFDQQVDVSQTGSVIQVGDGIAKVYGLDGAMAAGNTVSQHYDSLVSGSSAALGAWGLWAGFSMH